jgi:hypothetical protein
LSPPTDAIRLLSSVLLTRAYIATSKTSWLWMPANLLISFSFEGFQSCVSGAYVDRLVLSPGHAVVAVGCVRRPYG